MSRTDAIPISILKNGSCPESCRQAVSLVLVPNLWWCLFDFHPSLHSFKGVLVLQRPPEAADLSKYVPAEGISSDKIPAEAMGSAPTSEISFS